MKWFVRKFDENPIGIIAFIFISIFILDVTALAYAVTPGPNDQTTILHLLPLTNTQKEHTVYDGDTNLNPEANWPKNLRERVLIVVADNQGDPFGFFKPGENDFINPNYMLEATGLTIIEDSTNDKAWLVLTVDPTGAFHNMTIHVPPGEVENYVNIHSLGKKPSQ